MPEGYKRTKVGIVPEEWEEERFKEKFSHLTRKNTEDNTNVLTISAQFGLINQESFFNKSIASENTTNYFLLRKGEYAYNKSYSNGYPYGALKRLEKYESGIVSPLYICFSATEENKCPEFYIQYFEAGKMNPEIKAIAQEGARNHGLLNISVDDFFNAFIIVPPLAEQEKIAEILQTQDKLIELQQKKIDELKRLKKVYLSKMFPKKGCNVPEIRFPGFTAPWEQRKLGDIAEIVGGGTPSTSNPAYWDGDIDWYAPAEMEGKRYATSSVRKITELGLQKSSAKVLPAERTVLFTSRAGIGKMAILKRPGATNQGFQSLVIGDSFNPYFIYSMGEEIKSKAERVASGSTFLEISGKMLGNIEISVPSKQEQDAIAEYFERLDDLITLHQRKCDEEKQKKKALMQLLLTGIVRVKENE